MKKISLRLRMDSLGNKSFKCKKNNTKFTIKAQNLS